MYISEITIDFHIQRAWLRKNKNITSETHKPSVERLWKSPISSWYAAQYKWIKWKVSHAGLIGSWTKLAGWGRWGFNKRRQMWLPVTPRVKAQTYNSCGVPKGVKIDEKNSWEGDSFSSPSHRFTTHPQSDEWEPGRNKNFALVQRDQVEVGLTEWLTCIWRYFLSAGLRHCRKGWFHEARPLAWLSGAFSRWLWPGNERAGREGKGGGHRGDNRGGSVREKK